MKKILISFCILFITINAIAQTGMPSQEEMDKMMKQMQDVIKDMPPETKRMMDSMGMKMPDASKIPTTKTISGLEKQYKDAAQQAILDKKAALAALPKQVLTDAQLAVYLNNCFNSIDKMLGAETKANAEKIYAVLKSKGFNTDQLTTAALVLLLDKASQQSIWLLAKLSATDNKNMNTLNNFSSLATTLGGAQLAIPVLQNLNKKVPNNDVILNNLGQAYYALNAIDSAEKYLRLALKKFPDNSTANETMSDISDKKGNKADAVTFLKKSIKASYSEQKVAKLKKLGSPTTKKDLSLPFEIDPDPLGLKNYSIPPYAMTSKQSPSVAVQWEAFKEKMNSEAAKYDAEAGRLEPIVIAATQELLKVSVQKKQLPVGPLAEKTSYFLEENTDLQSILDELQANTDELKRLKKVYDDRSKEISIEHDKRFPHCPSGICDHEAECAFLTAAENSNKDAYLSAANKIYEKMNKQAMESLIKAQSMLVNISIFNGDMDAKTDMIVAKAKASFYKTLAGLEHVEYAPTTCGDNQKPKKQPLKIWVDSSALGCPYEYNIALGPVASTLNCKEFSFDWKEGVLGGITIKHDNFEKFTGDIEVRIGGALSAKFQEGELISAGLEASAYLSIALNINSNGYKLNDVSFHLQESAGLSSNIIKSNFKPTKDISFSNQPYDKLGNLIVDKSIKTADKSLGPEVKFEGNLSLTTGNSDYTVTTPIGQIKDVYVAPK